MVDLLLFDERNPRSILFQVAKIVKHVSALPGAASLDGVPEMRALEAGRAGRPAVVGRRRCSPGASLRRSRLSDALTLRYFSHAYELQYATTGR